MVLSKLTADVLVALAGTLIALLGFYVPVFKRWFDTLGDWTPLAMAVILLVVDVVYMLAWCALVWLCIAASWQEYLLVFLAALGTNYGTYKAIIKPVKMLRAKRALLAKMNVQEYVNQFTK